MACDARLPLFFVRKYPPPPRHHRSVHYGQNIQGVQHIDDHGLTRAFVLSFMLVRTILMQIYLFKVIIVFSSR